MNTIKLKWARKSSGSATWYETECKRFSLTRAGRGKWTLFDRECKDSCVPEFNRMETVYCLRDGMNKAQRWADGKTH